MIRDLAGMVVVALTGAMAAAASVEPTATAWPMSLLLWCFAGSFAGMTVAGPKKMREALAELQGRAALALELAVFGIGGVASLVGTSLLGFGVIGAMHLLGKQGIDGLAWAGKVAPADMAPFGILASGLMQVGAQSIMSKVVELVVSWIGAFKRGEK